MNATRLWKLRLDLCEGTEVPLTGTIGHWQDEPLQRDATRLTLPPAIYPANKDRGELAASAYTVGSRGRDRA